MKILRLQRQRQYLLLRQIEFQKPISQSHFQAQRDIGPVKVTSTCRTRKTSQPLIIRPFTTPESLELSKIHLKETKKSLNKQRNEVRGRSASERVRSKPRFR